MVVERKDDELNHDTPPAQIPSNHHLDETPYWVQTTAYSMNLMAL